MNTAAQKPLSEIAAKLLKRITVKGSPDKAITSASTNPEKYPIEVLKELCDLGLTFEEIESQKANVFHVLVDCGRVDFIPYVISKYPHCVNSTNNDGQTALHIIMLGNEDVKGIKHELFDSATVKQVNYLLGIGVDINAKDRFGNTALFYAQKTGYTDTVALLLERGATPLSTASVIPNVKSHVAGEKAKKAAVPPVAPSSAGTKYAAPSRSPASLFSNRASNVAVSPAASPFSVPPAAVSALPFSPSSSSSAPVFLAPVKTDSDREYQKKKKPSGFKAMVKKLIPGSTDNKTARAIQAHN